MTRRGLFLFIAMSALWGVPYLLRKPRRTPHRPPPWGGGGTKGGEGISPGHKPLRGFLDSPEVLDIHLGVGNRTEHLVCVHPGQSAVRHDHGQAPQPRRVGTGEPAAIHPLLVGLPGGLHVPTIGQTSPAVVLPEGPDSSLKQRFELSRVRPCLPV